MDEQGLNSILAQFENGIPQVIQSINQESSINSNSNKQHKAKGANLGGAALIKASVNETTSEEAEATATTGRMTQ